MQGNEMNRTYKNNLSARWVRWAALAVFGWFGVLPAAQAAQALSPSARDSALGQKSTSIHMPIAPAAALPDSLWYNGDFNGANAVANEVNTQVSDAHVFVDFTVPAGPNWTVTGLYSRNMMNFTGVTQANYEIRSGVSSGVAGTLLFSGTAVPATQTATGATAFGLLEYTILISGLSISLPPGSYHLNVAPIGFGSGRSYVSTTSGANAVGTPPGNNGNEFFRSGFFNLNYALTSAPPLSVGSDFSAGVIGTTVGFSCSQLGSVVGEWGINAGACGNFNSSSTVARYESAIFEASIPPARGSAPGEYAYEVEFVNNRPRQPSASTSIFVAGSPYPLRTATQNWDRAIAFNISGAGKYSVFRYNGSGLPVALQKWVFPVGVTINAAPASNVLRVERVTAGAGFNLRFFINGVFVRELPDTLGVDQFGTGFVRSLATTGNLVTDDWMEVLDITLDTLPQNRGRVIPEVSRAQQRANDAANASRGNDNPLFESSPGRQ